MEDFYVMDQGNQRFESLLQWLSVPRLGLPVQAGFDIVNPDQLLFLAENDVAGADAECVKCGKSDMNHYEIVVGIVSSSNPVPVPMLFVDYQQHLGSKFFIFVTRDSGKKLVLDSRNWDKVIVLANMGAAPLSNAPMRVAHSTLK